MTTTKAKPKAKGRPKAKKSTNQTPERERKILKLVDDAIRQRNRVFLAEREVENIKADLKEAKDHLELQQSQLNGIIAEQEAIRDGKPLQGVLPLQDAAVNGHPVDPSIAVLKLSEGLAEKLSESDIKTVGALEKAISAGELVPNRIKGVGPAAVDKVTDALVKFRAEHPVAAKDEKPKMPVESKIDPEKW
jgi:hypothetical protein